MAAKRTLDINRQEINEPIDYGDHLDMENPKRSFNFKDASLTLLLAIIAIWSAYFVTQLLNGHELKLFSKSTPKTATPKTTTNTPTTPAPATTPTTTTPSSTSTNNPFASIKDNTNTPVTTTTPAPTTEIAKDSFTIRILNGNGVTGDGAKLKQELIDKGFKVTTVANARLKYSKTEIYYKSGKQAQADLVAKNIDNRQTETKEGSDELVGSDSDILVVTGKQ